MWGVWGVVGVFLFYNDRKETGDDENGDGKKDHGACQIKWKERALKQPLPIGNH